ncbi:MAG: hypothetical protein II916_06860 [Oscillospiraceae bacterium]|nr:hypothetical protein [Oscillospiraceae bacterium]
MILIPILCFAVMLYLLWKFSGGKKVGKKALFWREGLMVTCGAVTLFCTLCTVLRHFASNASGNLPIPVMIAVSVIPLGWLLVKEFAKNPKLTRFLKVLSIASVVILLAECCVFNARSFTTHQTVFADPTISYDGKVTETDEGYQLDGNSQLYLRGVHPDTRGIIIDVEREKERHTLPYCVTVGLEDDNFSEEYVNVQTRFSSGLKDSLQLTILPYGQIHAIRLDFGDVHSPLTVTGIHCVKRLPFAFNSLRFWLLLGLTALVAAIVIFGWYRIRYSQKNPVHLALVAVMIAVSIGGTWIVKEPDLKGWEYKDSAGTNDPFAMTFDAWQKGQVWLDTDVDPKLEDIENVYVRAQRDKSDASSHWDYAYYQGKYYVYFGVAPVVTYYYPYYFLTGKLPTVHMATYWFGTWAVLFLSLTLLAMVRIFCRRPNLLLLLLSLPVAPVVGGIYWAMNTGGYYMTPIAAGMCFLYLSLWTGLTACTLRKLWVRAVLLFVSGTALALSVASRPPIALAGVILIPFFVGILLDKRRKLQPKLLQAACFVVPVMLGAAGIMWYNHARFGSVTDFGAAYQLTVSNVNANKLRLSDFWGAMYTYFGGQTRPRASFPYFEPQWGNLYALSHYVYAEGTVGWLRYPMVLGSILCLPVVLRRKGTAHLRTTDKQRKTVMVLCILMSLLLAWMDYSMGGSNQRYLYDFASLLLCMSIPVLLLMNRNSAKHRYFYTLTCLALAASWCLEWLLLLENHDSGLCRRCPELYSTVERLVMFWN